MGVAGEFFNPPDLELNTDDWRDQEQKAVPPFDPNFGKTSFSYHYNAEQKWEGSLSRGTSHTTSGVGPGCYKNILLTVGDPPDAIGEQEFAALSKEALTSDAH